MTLVAADIGGTFSRFTWHNSKDQANNIHQKLVFENSLFTDFYQVLTHFLTEANLNEQPLQTLVLALPAPITGKTIRLTNIDWVIDSALIQQQYPFQCVEMVNDFQAAAIGAITTSPKDLLTLNHPGLNPDGPVVIAGAGTGLGMAWLNNHHQNELPHGTEGGHIDFAPNSALEIALYTQLEHKYGHVSYERVVSGNGLVNIYRFLKSEPELMIEPVTILQRAESQEEAALKSIELFFDVLAAYAGNLALLFNPTGGIYLCGGMTVRLLKWLDTERFMRTYSNKGRMHQVVNRIPLFMVNDNEFGLRGAINIAHNLSTN